MFTDFRERECSHLHAGGRSNPQSHPARAVLSFQLLNLAALDGATASLPGSPEGLVGAQEQQDRQVSKHKHFECRHHTCCGSEGRLRHRTALETGQEGCTGAWGAEPAGLILE